MTESFYDTLGVPSDADSEEIQRAYRQRIKETHPDLSDDPDASEKTATLVEAKDVLTDEDERARYDRIGHEAYVSDGFESTATDTGGDDSQSTAGATSTDTGSSGPSNVGSSAEQRRRRERRAGRDVDFGSDGNRESTASSGSTATTGATTGGATTGSGGTRSTATSEPPSWSDTSDGWAARAPTSSAPGLATHVFHALAEAPATAIVTFLLYPLLVLGTFLPSFPLVVNGIVGACLLAMIAAAQSVPGLGIAVYGAWSMLTPVGLIWTGTQPFSALGVIVLATTWLPLGFSLLTYKVLDA